VGGNDTRPVLLVDAMNLFVRSFVVNPTLNAHGSPAGGSVGFMKSLELLIKKIYPTDVHIVWEGGGSPRRRAIYPDYKKKKKPQRLNRFYSDDIPDTVENRNSQVALTVELLKNVPVSQIYVSDCEADDVIAYLSRYRYRDRKCVIVSSDKDFYQLLSDRVTQWSPGQKKFITPEILIEKFGIPAHNFCVVRCFCGDPSDSLGGIKGAGFKSMAKRFPELASSSAVTVTDILNESCSQMAKSKVKLFKSITENSKVPQRNWKLMNLDSSILAASQIQKINGIIDNFNPKRDKIGLMRILVREGLTTFDADTFFMTLNSYMRP
tara:strand:+ start:211 stop:1176 length:966 start_codon:yes stop_codon:yes gene_type:complete